MNNSGRSQRGMVVNTEFKVDQELFELNVLGTISLTKAVLPHMIERNAGHIVAVSSVVGKVGRLIIYFFLSVSHKFCFIISNNYLFNYLFFFFYMFSLLLLATL